MKLQKSIRLATTALTTAAFLLSLTAGIAAEKSAIDPTGAWKIATINPETNGKGFEAPMTLRLEGGKLTGSITHKSNVNGKTRITERMLKDTKLLGDSISFTVSFPPVAGQGPEVTQTYQGKITGDAMKGKLETEWNGKTFARDWEARRVKE